MNIGLLMNYQGLLIKFKWIPDIMLTSYQQLYKCNNHQSWKQGDSALKFTEFKESSLEKCLTKGNPHYQSGRFPKMSKDIQGISFSKERDASHVSSLHLHHCLLELKFSFYEVKLHSLSLFLDILYRAFFYLLCKMYTTACAAPQQYQLSHSKFKYLTLMLLSDQLGAKPRNKRAATRGNLLLKVAPGSRGFDMNQGQFRMKQGQFPKACNDKFTTPCQAQ